jgi:hypothetical protein
MTVLVPFPNDLAARFGSEAELGRRAVEALALEEYRAGRLTCPELQHLLGFTTEPQLDRFLKDRGVAGEVSGAKSTSPQVPDLVGHPAPGDLVARFQAFAAAHTLDGLDIKDLIREGRR